MANISFIVPALNEGEAVRGSVAQIHAAARNTLESYEIVLVDDGSTDSTGAVMDTLAAEHPAVKAVHNRTNLGLGGAFKRGVEAASLEYVMMIPGDDAHPADGIVPIIREAGTADLVVSYVVNPEARNRARRIISATYTRIANLLIGLSVPYYNGLTIYRRELVMAANLRTASFAYQVELIGTLLRRGHTVRFVPTHISERNEGRTKAFRLKNVIEVGRTLLRLFWKVRVHGASDGMPHTSR